MKTKNIVSTDKTFVEQMREIRDKISLEIKDLTPEQLKDYLQSKKTLHSANVWPKHS
jgi:hypothetical protein